MVIHSGDAGEGKVDMGILMNPSYGAAHNAIRAKAWLFMALIDKMGGRALVVDLLTATLLPEIPFGVDAEQYQQALKDFREMLYLKGLDSFVSLREVEEILDSLEWAVTKGHEDESVKGSIQ